jgi:hypothetical protein
LKLWLLREQRSRVEDWEGRKMKKQNLWMLFFCGFWLLASSEYHLYQNRFLNRTEIRDRSGKTKCYLRENRFTGRTEIKTKGGRKAGEIDHNRFLDRVEVRDKSGQKR